jgi:hypothetical protein
MDRLEGIELSESEYEASEAHLLARLDSMAGND